MTVGAASAPVAAAAFAAMEVAFPSFDYRLRTARLYWLLVDSDLRSPPPRRSVNAPLGVYRTVSVVASTGCPFGCPTDLRSVFTVWFVEYQSRSHAITRANSILVRRDIGSLTRPRDFMQLVRTFRLTRFVASRTLWFQNLRQMDLYPHELASSSRDYSLCEGAT